MDDWYESEHLGELFFPTPNGTTRSPSFEDVWDGYSRHRNHLIPTTWAECTEFSDASSATTDNVLENVVYGLASLGRSCEIARQIGTGPLLETAVALASYAAEEEAVREVFRDEARVVAPDRNHDAGENESHDAEVDEGHKRELDLLLTHMGFGQSPDATGNNDDHVAGYELGVRFHDGPCANHGDVIPDTRRFDYGSDYENYCPRHHDDLQACRDNYQGCCEACDDRHGLDYEDLCDVGSCEHYVRPFDDPSSQPVDDFAELPRATSDLVVPLVVGMRDPFLAVERHARDVLGKVVDHEHALGHRKRSIASAQQRLEGAAENWAAHYRRTVTDRRWNLAFGPGSREAAAADMLFEKGMAELPLYQRTVEEQQKRLMELYDAPEPALNVPDLVFFGFVEFLAALGMQT